MDSAREHGGVSKPSGGFEMAAPVSILVQKGVIMIYPDL